MNLLEETSYRLPPHVPSLLVTARAAALAAGAAILEVYASDDFDVQLKADASPLTRADAAAHAIISRQLATTQLPLLSEEGALPPYSEREKWDWYWLVDPLDGTKEFIKKNGEFTVNIALMHQMSPVAGVVFAPALPALYYGSGETGVFKEVNGTKTPLTPRPAKRSLDQIRRLPKIVVTASRSHRSPQTDASLQPWQGVQEITLGSSLKFMLLAEGKADLNPKFGATMEWDTAASHAILNALNLGIYHTHLTSELSYNKPDLRNPDFLAF